MKAHTRIRVVASGVTGMDSSVYFVDGDGVETEISAAVQKVVLTVDVLEVNRATVHCTLASIEANAELDRFIIGAIPSHQLPGLIADLQQRLAEIEEPVL